MRARDIGALPVCEDDRVVGVVTDRDITVRATAEGRGPKKTKVRDVMTWDIVCVPEDQTVQDAARLMEERQVRRVLVLNHDQRLVGIVSLGDLAVGTGQERLAGEVLKRVSEPSGP
jgi:CBS domain-containing protein